MAVVSLIFENQKGSVSTSWDYNNTIIPFRFRLLHMWSHNLLHINIHLLQTNLYRWQIENVNFCAYSLYNSFASSVVTIFFTHRDLPTTSKPEQILQLFYDEIVIFCTACLYKRVVTGLYRLPVQNACTEASVTTRFVFPTSITHVYRQPVHNFWTGFMLQRSCTGLLLQTWNFCTGLLYKAVVTTSLYKSKSTSKLYILTNTLIKWQFWKKNEKDGWKMKILPAQIQESTNPGLPSRWGSMLKRRRLANPGIQGSKNTCFITNYVIQKLDHSIEVCYDIFIEIDYRG